ncbi:MAG TPA: N-acetylglucosamine-6-phosphate deacetylase [Bacilli bacterium]|jgi:N-acetylglucosamine-6-phosphate deacetylase|nr:N-acetylglucosamine-6-phosphate deacetylase [Acholeplasmataceae bacterium]OQB62182.1 MAG: N-acetylglucosamine-6-phosphate deacetylase [Tenericutes bacterium ADurb.Bin140]HOE77445.1 N-acetylglucosamine-6-phosphate deacetylase [Bacilli bacterium]HOR96491.1 N-acetylglucosamine-6-phosphate deacetylase [Bacilli bacterium]HPD12624.1 N-acetylglucosamine-6-phosphate deacetylase [Bacilli bacterium]
MKGFNQVKAYVEGKGIVKTSLKFENGLISEITDSVVSDGLTIPENWLVLPGYIDQHVHGAAGCDAMDATTAAISTMAMTVAQEGVTTFCPTTMTQSVENINKALANIKQYIEENHPEGAKVLGVHLEGPYISKDYIGAQPLSYVQNPGVESFKKYQKASGNHIRIVTLAPEVSGSEELIPYLVQEGIVASIGHTASKFQDVKKAVGLGARNLTHTYNAMRPLHHREIGTVGAAFLLDDLACEIICDGIHLSVPAMQLLLKNKPKDKVILVTDAMRAKAIGEGESELGGQKVFVKNGEARLGDGTLAGSVLTMDRAVRNMINLVGLPIEQAVDMATINPAKNLGIDKEEGSIAKGKKANFVVVDENFNVKMTIREGRIIYQA